MSRNPLALGAYLAGSFLFAARRKPLLASYKLTTRCNLSCVQCPFHSGQGRDPSFEAVKSTLLRLYASGVRIIVFEGGEPTLWRDGPYRLQDVVDYARGLFFCVGATTNGTSPLEVNTDIFWVSLDGLRETHDRLRGAGVFDRVLANIRRSRHPKLFAHITANRENYLEIPMLVRFLAPLVKGITVQFYYPYHHQDDLYLDLPTRASLIDQLIALKQTGFPIHNSIPALRALKTGQWRCRDWLVACAETDGSIRQGCYLSGRDDIDCTKCGFTPYTEISLAYQGNPRAIWAGLDIFFRPT